MKKQATLNSFLKPKSNSPSITQIAPQDSKNKMGAQNTQKKGIPRLSKLLYNVDDLCKILKESIYQNDFTIAQFTAEELMICSNSKKMFDVLYESIIGDHCSQLHWIQELESIQSTWNGSETKGYRLRKRVLQFIQKLCLVKPNSVFGIVAELHKTVDLSTVNSMVSGVESCIYFEKWLPEPQTSKRASINTTTCFEHISILLESLRIKWRMIDRTKFEPLLNKHFRSACISREASKDNDIVKCEELVSALVSLLVLSDKYEKQTIVCKPSVQLMKYITEHKELSGIKNDGTQLYTSACIACITCLWDNTSTPTVTRPILNTVLLLLHRNVPFKNLLMSSILLYFSRENTHVLKDTSALECNVEIIDAKTEEFIYKKEHLEDLSLMCKHRILDVRKYVETNTQKIDNRDEFWDGVETRKLQSLRSMTSEFVGFSHGLRAPVNPQRNENKDEVTVVEQKRLTVVPLYLEHKINRNHCGDNDLGDLEWYKSIIKLDSDLVNSSTVDLKRKREDSNEEEEEEKKKPKVL